jgi:phosphatidylglycerophosphate synthase
LPPSSALAYKAYEIEELVDIYFYRRLGYVVAIGARRVRLSPNAVSVLAAVIGAVGGGLIAWPRLAWLGVALLVLYGIVDSADGQLARMTGQTSELGRVLDGVAGYVTHIAIYLSIVAVMYRAAGRWSVVGIAVVSGVFTAIQAQLYDYHRTAYAAFVVQGRVPRELASSRAGGALGRLAAAYTAIQRRLLGLHSLVEGLLASRAVDGRIPDNDRQRYRHYFYGPVCGWNLLGDNVRRYAVATCVLLGHVEWFIPFTLGPMTLALAVLWAVQRRADRAFLAAFDPASGRKWRG